ncbi:hypothetical protein [Brucella inopinata]|uniref:Uncharacterized protein n=1 Tax=Brucella inopinata TaxID=1218315 RepID=A0AAW7B8D1_9HYPH|nr:hypothetical protein [Brucella inopinata]MDL2334155.1 hypothetical protein [Brucella inopinata]
MVPKKGTDVLKQARRIFLEEMSIALKSELGDSRKAAKEITRWTGASDRTAKYWLSGARAPSGWQLVVLAEHSDAVLHAVLRLSRRNTFQVSVELNAVKAALKSAIILIDDLTAP